MAGIPNQAVAKERRRVDAKERKEYYATLTPTQKLAALDRADFKATKQRARLEKLIEASK